MTSSRHLFSRLQTFGPKNPNFEKKYKKKIKIVSRPTHNLFSRKCADIRYLSEICSVFRKILIFCSAYFLTHDDVG